VIQEGGCDRSTASECTRRRDRLAPVQGRGQAFSSGPDVPHDLVWRYHLFSLLYLQVVDEIRRMGNPHPPVLLFPDLKN
jgi:hypothetical protein